MADNLWSSGFWAANLWANNFWVGNEAGQDNVGGGGITGIDGNTITDYFAGIASPEGVTKRTD